MKKNIMVILCDQLRKDFLHCYGGTECSTPNIDKLAKNGVKFNCAITSSPVCAPARAGMMTGRYVSDHGVWTNDVSFRNDMDYLPQRMKQAGYKTAVFGKLHHYPATDTKGFDISFQMEENRLGENDDYFKWLKNRHNEIKDEFPKDKNGNFLFSELEYYDHWIADKSIEFIKKLEQPFFAWVSFQNPHVPLDPPKKKYSVEKSNIKKPKNINYSSGCDVPEYRKIANYANLDFDYSMEYRQKYACLIEEVDDQIGRIIETLKLNNQFENTIIIFSADHGDMCGDLGQYQKGPMPYSAQLEIPLLLSNCNGYIGNYEFPVSNLDIGATALDIAGDNKPFGISRSLIGMYKGTEEKREETYSEFCDSIKIIDDQNYRFAYYPFTGQSQLFDKKLENFETKNMSYNLDYQELKAKYLEEIIDYMIVAQGVHIESQDLVPSVQNGLIKKQPNFKDQIPLVFPLRTQKCRKNLKNSGLNPDYNEFCKYRNVLRHYGTYWITNEEKHSN